MRISFRAAGLILILVVTVIGACGPNDTSIPGTQGSATGSGTGFTPPPTSVSSATGFNVVAYYSTTNGDLPYFIHEQDLDYITETLAHGTVNGGNTITTANTYQSGDMIIFNGVTLPSGINQGQYYYAYNTSGVAAGVPGAGLATIGIASTLALAVAGTPDIVFTDAGSGTFTISLVAEAQPHTSVVANEIAVNHTYTTGDEISFPTSFSEQAESLAFGTVGSAAANEITTVNSYSTGDKILFNGGLGAPVGVLANTVYFAIRIDATHIKVAISKANALANQPLTISAATSGSFVLTDASVKTTQATLPTGLFPNTNYYAINVGANLIKVATTLANANAGTAVAIANAGSGTFNVAHYIYGNLTSSCAIPTGTTGEALNCVLEADEEDLWFNGVTLQYNVPAGMCNYIVMMPYDYYVMEPGNVGVVPLSATYDEGNQVYIDTSGSTFASIGPSGTVTLNCPYDYSHNDPAGPNCCEGTYTVAMSYQNATVPAVTPTIAGGSFGGKVVNCLAGPAADLQPKDQAGFPESTIFYGTNGVNQTLQVAAPMNKSNPYLVQQQSDIYVANYMDLVKYHGGTLPAAFAPQFTTHLANPNYSFTCFDSAFEVINSVSLQIRKWDQMANYNTNKSAMTATQYGAYSATNCPVSSTLIGAVNGTANCSTYDVEPISLGGGPIDDHWGWRTYQAYWDTTLGQSVAGAGSGLFPANAQEQSGY